jgi:N-acetylglucosamine kinase-like BadF-type ATPase
MVYLFHFIEHVEVVGISLGMSGVDRPEDKTTVLGWLEEYCGKKESIEFRVSNDAFTAISSGTLGILNGMVIIAGTGSICIGTDGTNSVRVGGWGPLLGDEGSGWAIGHEVCVSVARAVDGLGPQTILVDMIQEFLNLENPQQLIPWTYKDLEWSRMAKIATLALRAHEKGDEVATGILERASTRLVEYAECVAKKMKWEDEFTLVLNGSLVTSEDSPLRKMVMDKISKKLPKAKITFPSVPPEMGAALLLIK